MENISELQKILEGKSSIKKFINEMENEMKKASDSRQYEKAKEIRDTLHRLSNLRVRQKMEKVVSHNSDEEYIGIVRDTTMYTAHIMSLRRTRGVISDSKKFDFDLIGDNSLTTFLSQYFSTVPVIPRFVYVNEDVESKNSLERSLEQLAEHPVSIIKISEDFPVKEKRQLMNLLMRNLMIHIEKGYDPDIIELKNVVNLPTIPAVIDCFDISNFGTSFAVGSCTRFVNGKPNKAEYRKFKVRTIPSQNDFAMIEEVIMRRYPLTEKDIKDQMAIPDLIVIDGGKGQLSSAINAIHKIGLDIPCISLAKENEEIYTAYSSKPVILPKSNGALKVLQYIRDEAHRFGLAYNVTLRKICS
jgi:excinuclease ABC subunit C